MRANWLNRKTAIEPLLDELTQEIEVPTRMRNIRFDIALVSELVIPRRDDGHIAATHNVLADLLYTVSCDMESVSTVM